MNLDKIDRQILDLLQADGSLPIVEIARQVGLTKVPCWKRVDRLKKAGVIARFTAIVDKKTVGNIFTYFLTVESPDKTPRSIDDITGFFEGYPETEEIHLVIGSSNLMVKLNFFDRQCFDDMYWKLNSTFPGVRLATYMSSGELYRSLVAINFDR